MNNNSLGKIFSVTSFGESHGQSVGCVINGVPAGLQIDLQTMQNWVNLRKTNQQNFASNRTEEDKIDIISGVFETKTIGSPICLLIKNNDAKSSDYEQLKDVFRPNHADFTNQTKYGIRDYRGGGRTSIRITAPIVAAGSIAMQFINHYYPTVLIQSFVEQIGEIGIPKNELENNYTDEQIFETETRCPHKETTDKMLNLLATTKVDGDTLGGIIKSTIFNLPIGLGEPIFYKLQAALSYALFSINTVKAVEFGDGFNASTQFGSNHNDEFINNKQTSKIETKTNHSGGIQGGISNGMNVNIRSAFKPISSISKAQQTLNQKGDNIALNITGRHDVCAVPRAIPIVNAYIAIIIADMILQQKIATI